jgi:hypothetical protein
MYNIIALLVAGAVLAVAGTAFAGEPTGRYTGAVGSLPQGVEQAYADYSEVGGGYVTAAFAQDIPAGQVQGDVDVALRNVGRALVVTASIPGGVDNVRLASRQ